MKRTDFIKLSGFGFSSLLLTNKRGFAAEKKPNIVFIFSDDHAVNSISAYSGKLNKTPNIDRIAKQGALFKANYCANSVCAPSRAAILTGKHSHLNGVMANQTDFDGSQQTFPKLLQKAGYTTGIVGKWHLRTDPTGFDEWMILPGQGQYYGPDYITADGKKKFKGYCVEKTTDLSLEFIEKQKDSEKPFLLMCQYKAPHRNFMPGPKYLNMYDDVEIPEPPTLLDDYEGRATPAGNHKMGIAEHMKLDADLKVGGMESKGLKSKLERMTPEQLEKWNAAYEPKNKKFLEAKLEGKALVKWKYQRYIKDYLRCVAAVDDNVGRITDYLEKNGLSDNTIVIYSSDQGFYLGEHGWFDKRWMYEESFRMPLMMKWPGHIKPGTVIDKLTQNIDFGPTFLDAAGIKVPDDMQGESFLPLLNPKNKKEWRKSLYYHYYMHKGHGVAKHYGVKTKQYKLMHFYVTDEWELFDLKNDPREMKSEYDNPEYANIKKMMHEELARLRELYKVPIDTSTGRGNNKKKKDKNKKEKDKK